ncbi:MAG TPA: lipid-A-disaccharide synthase [Candidatus Binatia bacterium]|nr:lipid-A-disaccharide synthase [Candidatus Binatia bacterium]
MGNQEKQVMVVVGEASGDIHGAQFVEALLKRLPTVKVFGVAGEQLRKTRFEVLFGVSKLTGMGLVELASNLSNIWHAYRFLRRALQERSPNLLVLIDFPDFNLRLAKFAKALRIPVLYYVSPQVWAWRPGRVRQVARWVDQMAVVFPFEVPFYRSHGVNVTFVGHPLLDKVYATETRDSVLIKLGLQADRPTVAILPGSRRKEVSYHLPVLLDAADRLHRKRGVQFLCVRASTVSGEDLAARLAAAPFKIPIVEGQRYDAMHAADLVWTASGTATVETALLLKPMIIVYRVSWLTYGAARLLVKVPRIGMVNILAGESVVPELVQSDFTAQKMIDETERFLNDAELRQQTARKLADIKNRLGSPGAAERVADLALSLMDGAAASRPCAG